MLRYFCVVWQTFFTIVTLIGISNMNCFNVNLQSSFWCKIIKTSVTFRALANNFLSYCNKSCNNSDLLNYCNNFTCNNEFQIIAIKLLRNNFAITLQYFLGKFWDIKAANIDDVKCNHVLDHKPFCKDVWSYSTLSNCSAGANKRAGGETRWKICADGRSCWAPF